MKFSTGRRNDEEKIIDRLLVLYTFADCPNEIGDTVLQKLAFLSSIILTAQGDKGFNYDYIKLTYGPFSKDLDNDLKALIDCKLVTRTGHTLTKNGKELMAFLTPILQRNQDIVRKIHSVNERYCTIPRDELVQKVHAMQNPARPGITIHETRDRTYLFRKPTFWDSEKEFKITESELASLEVLLDPRTSQALSASIEEAQEKPSVLYKSV